MEHVIYPITFSALQSPLSHVGVSELEVPNTTMGENGVLSVKQRYYYSTQLNALGVENVIGRHECKDRESLGTTIPL